ncbi:formylmethanofuran dehydrogenase subunit C [Fimbriiglobus ruber]|uniref:Formylmethanofuran dehydrogenase (Tungsten) subunit C n=1 Tax=Fimbriiglobus ruber TaxID=1908690 RepID=A0A225D258_9BACT|nr:formylmethanofuran dehydrogenase subunit C [Fimbriiglobus ruber]OWK35023.1 Formylmethanofuran dehydrogenase (tungsten) subunit C [Fimbriiglobus ruber]
MLTLTLRQSSPIPLELEGVTPDRVRGLSPLEISKLPVYHGNHREEVGQFFAVTGSADDGHLHIAGETDTIKHVGAGMTAGTITVEGNVGMHAGAGMTGGRLAVAGDAGDWLGAEMAGGAIEVAGRAGNQVGAAYRGSRRGMRGGSIVVRGAAGHEVGLLMRRGIIVVEGAIGEFAAASMIAGTLVAAGGVGRGAGAGMKRGTILVGGPPPELAPGMQWSCDYRPAFLGLLLSHLRTLDVRATDRFVARDVRCYRGDLVNGGTGELLVLCG